MNRNLVGSTCGRFCIKFPQSRMKGERYRPTEPLVIELECMCINLERGHHGRDHMQSVHIVSKVVSSNPDHGEVYTQYIM